MKIENQATESIVSCGLSPHHLKISAEYFHDKINRSYEKLFTHTPLKLCDKQKQTKNQHFFSVENSMLLRLLGWQIYCLVKYSGKEESRRMSVEKKVKKFKRILNCKSLYKTLNFSSRKESANY